MYLTQALTEAEQFLNLYSNKSTNETYTRALQVFHDFMILNDIKTINQVTLPVAELFKSHLEANYSPKTSNMYVATIKKFIQFLAIKANGDGVKLNTQFLLVKPTKVNSREQKTLCLTEQEVNKLLKVIYNLPNDLQSNNLKVMTLLMINAGLRESELVNLQVSDLTLQGNHYIIKVLGKGMKFRYISLSRPVTTELIKVMGSLNITQGYIIRGEDPLGNYSSDKAMNRTSIFRRVKRLADMAEIDKDISPHSLRRTCATIMYKRGAPIEVIQRMMGHDNPATTQRYIDMEVDIEMSKEFALDMTNIKENV
jgi:integrase/recombinase XerD